MLFELGARAPSICPHSTRQRFNVIGVSFPAGKRHSVSGGVCRAEPLSKADDLCRAAAIGDLWSYPKTRSIAELAIDAEEDRMVRALLVGMLREAGGLGR